MATDPNKKTLRHFQCRDYLWDTFEQMSSELECSVDYLVNEAMRQYARSRSYGARGAPGGAARDSAPPATSPPPPLAQRGPAGPPTSGPQQRPGAPPSVPGRGGAIPAVPSIPGAPSPRIPSLGAGAATLPPMRAPGAPSAPAAPLARPAGAPLPPLSRGPTVPPLPRPSARPTAPGVLPGQPGGVRVPAMSPPPAIAMPPARAPAGAAKVPPLAATPARPPPSAAPTQQTLYATYDGARYPVTKDEFVIGRQQKTSDLTIRDSNVSRRHAVVMLHNGQYWMVDQQSTNGVEFMGAKIDRKRIEDGDTFKICEYEIVFNYA